MTTISHELARRHLVFGYAESAEAIKLRHGPGVAPWTIGNLEKWCQRRIVPEVAEAESVAREIDAAYLRFESERTQPQHRPDQVPVITLDVQDTDEAAGGQGGGVARGRDGQSAGRDLLDLSAELVRAAASADADLLNTDQKGPVVRLVDSLLFDAIGQGASDIHIQPLADEVLVRYRVDGVLATARSVPVRLAASVVTRIKVMAKMDVAERRAPQDGRATVVIGGAARSANSVSQAGRMSKAIDLRISTLPTSFGERVVIRLLYADQTSSRATIAALAMPPEVQTPLLDRASRASGIVLVTGPTGSGKTTTLYALLRWIVGRSATGGQIGRSADMNVMTIEDPIEYDLSAADSVLAAGSDSRRLGGSLPISQTQVDNKKGLSFASGLRHILRQDPDVIMVGEIRDSETARIAIQASLTGHMVFSTLHTNDAPSAVSRLIDLEVEPFLICSTLSAVLAQRLVRLLHADCGGAGCPACLGTGFRGRRGLFELLLLDDPIRELVGRRASSTDLRDLALRRGMRSLSAEGDRLVGLGLTTSAEVHRVTLGVE